jgi:hypothetical protein
MYAVSMGSKALFEIQNILVPVLSCPSNRYSKYTEKHCKDFLNFVYKWKATLCFGGSVYPDPPHCLYTDGRTVA